MRRNRGRRECRCTNAPAALRVKIENTQVSHHRRAETSGIPCAMVLTAYSALSLVNRACCHHTPRNAEHCRELTPASGRQDHTASLSARALFVCQRPHVHRIPRPTSVTIAIRPSCGHRMARGHKDDLPDGESELFLRKGLDRVFAKLPDGQIREGRTLNNTLGHESWSNYRQVLAAVAFLFCLSEPICRRHSQVRRS